MQLYRWQNECLSSWESNGYRGIVHVVTGAGKTVLALSGMDLLFAQFPDLLVRIVVPTIPIAQMWQSALIRHAKTSDYLPGFYGGTRKDPGSRKIMVYIVNSARSALSKQLRKDFATDHHVLLICDECHHYTSPENRKIFDFITPKLFENSLYFNLGLSATPFSDPADAAFFSRMLGHEIYRYDFLQAQKEKVVSPFTICHIETRLLPEERSAYDACSSKLLHAERNLLCLHPELQNLKESVFMKRVSALAAAAQFDPHDPAAAFLLLAYQRKTVSVMAQARLCCCIDLIRRLRANDRILIFCERIEQAVSVSRLLRRHFGEGKCGLYHSKMNYSARKRNLESFRNGSCRILVSCKALDEGIDVPDANIGIVLSCSGTVRQRVQRLGRVIRRSGSKTAACLYYLYVSGTSDTSFYLPGIESSCVFELWHDISSCELINPMYAYAAEELLAVAKCRNSSESSMRELRTCFNEGMARADYLLPESEQIENALQMKSTHERNYWIAMRKIGQYFREGTNQNEL